MENRGVGEQDKPLLTFNALYTILRTEKKEKTLQNYPEKFYESLNEFINGKKEEVKKLKTQDEKQKLLKEKHILENASKISKEIISLRTEKIAKIASQNSLMEESFLGEENILEEEKELYQALTKSIKKLQRYV